MPSPSDISTEPADMPANVGNIHTQANNFLQSVLSSVDPRTGQFNLSITVPLGMANYLAGPSWPFTLVFSSLASQANRGFGLGWSLLYTELSKAQSVWSLRLSTGEQFAIDLDKSDLKPGGRLAFHDYKLKAMQVYLVDADTFKIVQKSGETEILRRVDGQSNAYVLHEMRSPEGHRLYLDWYSANNVNYLDKVRDESRTLAELNFDNGTPRLILAPGTSQEAVITFLQANGRLGALLLPLIEEPFLFVYESKSVGKGAVLLFPTSVTGPLGAQDTLYWSGAAASSHRLPTDAPIEFLPRVQTWLHSDGPNNSVLLHRYTWPNTRNYLGYGSALGFRWLDGRDNMYQLLERYEYSITETQSDAEGVTLATIHRTWDRHHLLRLERTVSGHCETTTQTEYDIDYDAPWSAQVPWCQLPKSITTLYTDTTDALEPRTRSEQIEYTYDEYGNIQSTRFPSGVKEKNHYFPASTPDSRCPYDASGFVRYLKQHSVFPAKMPDGSYGGAPVLATEYTYTTLPSLIEGDPHHAVVETEILRDDTHPQSDRLLENTKQHYITEQGPHYGRIEMAQTTLNGIATTTRYRHEISETEQLLYTHTTVEGFEGDAINRSTQSDARSLITGLTHEATSAAGATTAYSYDALGRIVHTVIAKGSPYEAVRSCDYHLDDEFSGSFAPNFPDTNTRISVGLEEVDATGQRRRTWLDGSGREVLVQMEDLESNPSVFRDISLTLYDALGRVTEHTTFDWLPEVNGALRLTTRTEYDDWGNVSKLLSAEGVTTHIEHDPISRRTSHWQESTDGKPGSKLVTLSNAAGSPIEESLYDSEGALVRTVRLTRDGLDRIVERRTLVTGQPDIVVGLAYDAYSRLIERTLPDGTKVTWTYSAHSDGDHPETVTVTPRQDS